MKHLILERHYAGTKSKQFWNAVKKLPRNEGGETAYMLGVVLQEVEERVLRYMEQCQPSPTPRRKP